MKMKILVVDDDRSLCRLCKEELEDEGYEVLTAHTGVGAMESFRQENPDLVVLDIKLPDVDGLELLDRMKTMRRDVPIIMHTTFDYLYDLASSASDAYIVKSADFVDLKAAVRRLAKGGRKGEGSQSRDGTHEGPLVSYTVRIREEHMKRLRVLCGDDEKAVNRMIDEALWAYLKNKQARRP